MIDSTLPNGVTRDCHCSPQVTLETCHALCFYFEHEDGTEASLIVWKDRKPNIRPAIEGKRLRDLRPGDCVVALGKPATLTAVEVYR